MTGDVIAGDIADCIADNIADGLPEDKADSAAKVLGSQRALTQTMSMNELMENDLLPQYDF